MERNYLEKEPQFFAFQNLTKIWASKLHSLIEIRSKKVCRNDADFLPIEITLKKYLEMTWKCIDIFFSTYQHNINIKWTSIRCLK